MNPVKAVLKEELANSLRLQKQYRKELRKLPKGSLVAKKIKGNIYHYLAKREGEKVVFEYLGKLPKEEIEKYEEAKDLRAKYRKLLSELKDQIDFLERSLSERKRRSNTQ